MEISVAVTSSLHGEVSKLRIPADIEIPNIPNTNFSPLLIMIGDCFSPCGNLGGIVQINIYEMMGLFI